MSNVMCTGVATCLYIVYVRGTGYGSRGPDADAGGHDSSPEDATVAVPEASTSLTGNGLCA